MLKTTVVGSQWPSILTTWKNQWILKWIISSVVVCNKFKMSIVSIAVPIIYCYISWKWNGIRWNEITYWWSCLVKRSLSGITIAISLTTGTFGFNLPCCFSSSAACSECIDNLTSYTLFLHFFQHTLLLLKNFWCIYYLHHSLRYYEAF